MTKPDDDGQIELRRGRTAPTWTDAHDWVGLAASVKPAAHSLYVKLKMHVNQKRGDAKVWPGKDSLAEMMDYDSVDTLDPYVDQLERVGAIDVIRVGMPARCLYLINDLPAEAYCTASAYPIGEDGRCKPHGGNPEASCEGQPYEGPLSLKDWYAEHRNDIQARKDAAKARRDAHRAKLRARRAATKQQLGPDTGSSPHQGEPSLDTGSTPYQETGSTPSLDTGSTPVLDTGSTPSEQGRTEQGRTEQGRTGGAAPPKPPSPQSPSAPGIEQPTSTSGPSDVEGDVIGDLRPRARGILRTPATGSNEPIPDQRVEPPVRCRVGTFDGLLTPTAATQPHR